MTNEQKKVTDDEVLESDELVDEALDRNQEPAFATGTYYSGS